MNLKRHSVKETEDLNGIKIKQDEDVVVIRFDDLEEFIEKCHDIWLKQYKIKHNLIYHIDLTP